MGLYARPTAYTQAQTLAGLSAIRVLCPIGFRTGGPEALHQLVDSLRRHGRDAMLVPLPGTENAVPVLEFAHYQAPIDPEPYDVAETAVVVPEGLLRYARRIGRATPVVWWLSVDYSPIFKNNTPREAQAARGARLAIMRNAGQRASSRLLYRALLGRSLHLAQSEYARFTLKDRLGLNALPVSDYTSAPLFDRLAGPIGSRSIIAYNPVKGGALTRRLIENWPTAVESVDWRPIQGMSRHEVAILLSEADVYLDLGHHPGKDRMPREAARAGCVTVVARRGAAQFFDDVPLPDEHKVDANDIVSSTKTLRSICADPRLARREQGLYRATIEGEREVFDSQVRAAFVDPSGPYLSPIIRAAAAR